MLKNKQELLKLKHLLRARVSSAVSITTAKINESFSVKPKGVLVKVFVRMLDPIGLKYTAYRTRVIILFIKRCKHLYKHRGMVGLVNYLKASQVLFQQSLGGMKLHDTMDLKIRVSRTASGMPRIVDPLLRFAIRREDTKVMKFIMTLLSVFRVLEFPGKLKLGSITDAFKGDLTPGTMYWRVISHIPNFCRLVKAVQRENKVTPLFERGIVPKPIVKSAPGTALGQVSTNPFVLLLSARALWQKGMADCISYFIRAFEKGTDIPFPGLQRIWQDMHSVPLDLIPSMANIAIGRLGLKHEAAGKVRVFAMCDAWTQWVLEPLHSWIFDTLRFIVTDGTHDQLKPVRAKAGMVKSAFSLDLTAATDRLPISIQVKLLENLISKEFAVEWSRLLVGREYFLPASKKLGIQAMNLRYSVGQPMGALSSWAMLALTHHLIVQVAAWEAGYAKSEWYKEYAVLGDDLVIFDPKVKTQYLHIVEAIGVECGLAKSLLSSKGKVIEFAKKTFYGAVDISPVPVTEFLAAQYYLADAISFARKYQLSFAGLLRVLGYGKTVRNSINKHVGRLNSRVRALLFAYYLPVDDNEVQAKLLQGNPYLTEAQMKAVIEEFKLFMIETYSAKVAAKVKTFPDTPGTIKMVTDETVATVVGRLHLAGYLTTFVTRVLPGASETSISKDVESLVAEFNWTAKDFEDALRWAPKKFRVPLNSELPSSLTVPANIFSRVEHFSRSLNLMITRIVKLLVAPSMSRFRADMFKLGYSIDAIRFGRTPLAVYNKILANLAALNRAGTGIVSFERPLEVERKFAVDHVQLKLWRDFTRVLLRVLRKPAVKPVEQR
jgi:hypothetical protein